MSKLTPLAVLCISATVGCDKTTQPPVRELTAASPQTYGSAIENITPVNVGDVTARPDNFADKPIVIDGTIRQSCTRKGCWMELAPTAQTIAPGVRVTFKDYGFFIPVHSQGRRARAQGTLSAHTVSAEDVRHLESEGGHFANKAADGTALELAMVATGVAIEGPGSAVKPDAPRDGSD
ncbi:MAG: DUF4920 domain-containing protein [Clostridia bacterium]|nr:DUF4920 domain-containing protein [Deltaproteobacteria bacterium]